MTDVDILPPSILKRKAVVYVRQSSQAQVQHNLESQRRQYELVDEARRRGFRDVEVMMTLAVPQAERSLAQDLISSSLDYVPAMGAPFSAWMRCVWLAMDVTGTIYLSSAGWLRQGSSTLKACTILAARTIGCFWE